MSAPTTGRPSVTDVALLIRARTKDSTGEEAGTFTDHTRPTAQQVEDQIDAALALVSTRLPPLDDIPPLLMPAVSSLVAYRAALRIEKSYFPEQVRSDRSAYQHLYQEYQDDLAALVERIKEGGPELLATQEMGMLKVGSWTSMFPGDDVIPRDVTS